MPPLTLTTPPVYDQDNKNSKKASKLRGCHLWNREGNVNTGKTTPDKNLAAAYSNF
jgi:hypothetical protein